MNEQFGLTKEQISLLLTMMQQVNWPGSVLKLAAETMAVLERMLKEAGNERGPGTSDLPR